MTFETILDKAYEKSLTINSEIKGLQRECWFQRNKAEILALGADFSIGSAIYGVVLANPWGILALAGGITARKLTAEGYDYYQYQSSMKALKNINENTKKLSDIEILLNQSKDELVTISQNAKSRINIESQPEKKVQALTYLSNLDGLFDLNQLKDELKNEPDRNKKLQLISNWEEVLNNIKLELRTF